MWEKGEHMFSLLDMNFLENESFSQPQVSIQCARKCCFTITSENKVLGTSQGIKKDGICSAGDSIESITKGAGHHIRGSAMLT